jgi:hypothetical protein
MRLCERPVGHDGPHQTSVDRAIEAATPDHTVVEEKRETELTETEAVQEFAARHGVPLPEGLHIDSNLVGPRKHPPGPPDAPKRRHPRPYA